MSQTIRVSDETYDDMENLQDSIEETEGFAPTKKELADLLLGWSIEDYLNGGEYDE